MEGVDPCGVVVDEGLIRGYLGVVGSDGRVGLRVEGFPVVDLRLEIGVLGL